MKIRVIDRYICTVRIYELPVDLLFSKIVRFEVLDWLNVAIFQVWFFIAVPGARPQAAVGSLFPYSRVANRRLNPVPLDMRAASHVFNPKIAPGQLTTGSHVAHA